MRFRRRNNLGFTMVELLVVLVIIGILAAVATPIFFGNTERAKASEAVAGMSLIRQRIREYQVQGKTLVDITVDDILKLKVKDGGLDIGLGTVQYFSNNAYRVDFFPFANNFVEFEKPEEQNFVIVAKGADSDSCDAQGASADCADKQLEVKDYELQMDDSGRIRVTYGSGFEDY